MQAVHKFSSGRHLLIMYADVHQIAVVMVV